MNKWFRTTLGAIAIMSCFVMPVMADVADTPTLERFSDQHKRSVKYYQTIELDYDRLIIIRGEIRANSMQPLINQLIQLEKVSKIKPIYIIINSPGGSVEAGMRFVHTMNAIKAPIIAVVETGAYSMAAIIAAYIGNIPKNKVYMVDLADMMFHEAAYCICGMASVNLSRIKSTEKYLTTLNKRVARQTHVTYTQYMRNIASEWWLTAEEAVYAGIADGIVMSLKYEWTPPPSVFILFGDTAVNDDIDDAGVYIGDFPPTDCATITFN